MGRVTTFIISLALLVGLTTTAPVVRVTPYDATSAGAPVTRVAIVGDSYTNGTAIGGQGPNAWPVRAWKTLAQQGLQVASDVAAEGRAGYG
ncbi:MAG: Rv0518 family GDSL lipase, partial [Myxococcota bacterium]